MIIRLHNLYGTGWALTPVLALVLVFSLAMVGCDILSTREPAPTNTPAGPTATALPATAVPKTVAAEGLLLQVTVATAPADIPKYDRGEWRHWTDDDRDCQNARQEVLIDESSVPVVFEDSDQCRVQSGSWVGPYTGQAVTNPGDLDIDHMVPLENAHRSGAWAWDRDRKREFANYLGYDDHLIASTSRANRSKGSKGPEEWRPALESYWCEYATNWIAIKNAWKLTVTRAEFLALREMLATCPMPVLLQRSGDGLPSPVTTVSPQQTPVTTLEPTATPMPTATLPPGLRFDPFGPDKNCGDFDTYQEALEFFIAAGGPGKDPHNLDSDGDGEPCASLPRAGTSGNLQERETEGENSSSTAASLPASTQGPPETPGPTLTATVSPTPTTAPTPAATPTPTPQPEPEPTATPTKIPSPTPPSTSTPAPTREALPTPTLTPNPTPPATLVRQFSSLEMVFDPNGPDRSCGDFETWWDAQNFYLAAGGPDSDPHHLDGNSDGIACESLRDSPGGASGSETGGDFEDRNCGDFDTWQEAQDFFLSEGGPDSDPHGLDANGDGNACESLPGFGG